MAFASFAAGNTTVPKLPKGKKKKKDDGESFSVSAARGSSKNSSSLKGLGKAVGMKFSDLSK